MKIQSQKKSCLTPFIFTRNVVDFGVNLLPGSSFPDVGSQLGQGNYGTATILLGTELLGPLGKELRGVRSIEKAGAESVTVDLLKDRSTTIPSGVWQNVNEAMSVRAAEYQTQITERTGQSYVVNGLKFDGADLGVYLEAKGPGYANFVNKNGEFYGWYNGKDALINQAERQVTAAKGVPIEWHVAEQKAADAMRNMFNKAEIKGISVIYTPAKVIK